LDRQSGARPENHVPNGVLKGAVVGLGRMGLTHYSILNTHPAVRFCAVCDPSSFMLRNVRRFSGLQSYANYQELFESEELDFAIIATPTSSHGETIACAIDHGVHAFVEKPFALATGHGRALVDRLAGKGLVNQVGYVIRFNDVMVHVKRLLEQQLLGELYSFRVEMSAPTVLRPTKEGWRSRKSEGGGCLYDFSSHSIDLINYLFGPPQRVAGTVFKSIYSSNVEDAVYSTFLYENGLSGHFAANWSDPSFRKPTYRIEILGRAGKVIADLHAYKLFFKQDPPVPDFRQGWNIRYVTELTEPVRFYVRGNEFTRQLDYFIQCILDERPATMCSFADGLTTDEIIESLIEDSGGGRR
jgi:predicted dehydrogenase